MSGECEYCGYHSLECECRRCITQKNEEKKSKNSSKKKKLNLQGLSQREQMIAIENWENDQLKVAEKVNHPPHYQGKTIEVIDVIEDFGLGFCLGNAVKYILRSGKKGDRIEDLKKAIWYLSREVAKK